VLVYVDPSILYVIPAPVGAVIVIAPVASLQLGCVSETVGAEGVNGCVLIVTPVTEDSHPDAFITVTLYVPDVTPLNTVDD